MKTKIQLQDSFSYYIWPAIVFLAIAAGIILFFAVQAAIRKRKNRADELPVIVQPANIYSIKPKYLARLAEILQQVNSNQITVKKAYFQVSDCIRGFIQEATGINAKSFTLQDARRMNMPVLERLMQEYYTPEFAYRSAGDINQTISNSREAIESWN